MKVVVFDMDGTLIAESSWELLHTYFRADPKKVNQNKTEYFSQRIDYTTWMEKDIELWNSPSIEDICKGLSSFTLEPYAKEVVTCLKGKGIIPCIVSSGIKVLASMVGETLGIDPAFIFANSLILQNGTLKGVLTVEPYQKDKIVTTISRVLAVPLAEFAAVGDASPDVSMFKAAALTFAYNAKDDTIVEAADYVLTDLRDLLSFC
jgi:HAD superfamily PSPase-like hydrolase